LIEINVCLGSHGSYNSIDVKGPVTVQGHLNVLSRPFNQTRRQHYSY